LSALAGKSAYIGSEGDAKIVFSPSWSWGTSTLYGAPDNFPDTRNFLGDVAKENAPLTEVKRGIGRAACAGGCSQIAACLLPGQAVLAQHLHRSYSA
jgi:hypothetical protein